MNSEFELIYDFEIGDELSDVELHVETKVFRVHKAILASASPVFRKMFTADFLERASNRVHLPCCHFPKSTTCSSAARH